MGGCGCYVEVFGNSVLIVLYDVISYVLVRSCLILVLDVVFENVVSVCILCVILLCDSVLFGLFFGLLMWFVNVWLLCVVIVILLI